MDPTAECLRNKNLDLYFNDFWTSCKISIFLNS